MSIKPILFNGEMVRAILGDRKTVTRRIVKLKYSNTHLEMRTDKYGARLIELQNEEPGVTTIKKPDGTITHTLLAARVCHPPYRPGDVLYVRETWANHGSGYYYRADADERGGGAYYLEHRAGMTYESGVRWRPSLHMPREAARIWLRVTDVRVERLQEIDEDGAIAEGLYKGWRLTQSSSLAETARQAFMWLWLHLARKAPDEMKWSANPWVWVIEFERCEKPEDM